MLNKSLIGKIIPVYHPNNSTYSVITVTDVKGNTVIGLTNRSKRTGFAYQIEADFSEEEREFIFVKQTIV
jgi:hypothetical protein